MLEVTTMMIPTATMTIPSYVFYNAIGWGQGFLPLIIPGLFGGATTIFFLRSYMASIPTETIEAAKIDGAGPYRIFFQIVFPMVKPCVMTLSLFGFRDVWATVPNGTVFDETLKTLPTIMTQITAGGIARAGSAMAVTVILMLPPILVYMISQSNVLESMNSAGIK